ncbi:MAG: hypothetical protein ABII13_01355 [Patescibacteria group bacterium]|nr:hypothetical protein [Patescibacteria group bacterium]MBU2509342.1 hypothetical protein [Patescibacteria group bacterium]
MSRRKFDISSEKVQLVLNLLKLTGGIAFVLLFPNAVQLLAPKRRKFYSDKDFRKTAYYLKRRGDICFVDKKGKKYVELTKQGLERLRNIDDFQIKRLNHNPDSWDGKWRIVIFDIPENERSLRNAFRRKLRELDFRHLQGSVWICPYEVRGDIRELRKAGGFEEIYIQCILAEEFDEEKEYRNKFKLKSKK